MPESMAWVAEELVWQTTSFAALHQHRKGWDGCWSDVVAPCPLKRRTSTMTTQE